MTKLKPLMSSEEQYEALETILTQEKQAQNKEIVVYNDNINTFDYVIETLMSVCEHTLEQAQQCTILVHYIGKCTVKTGIMEELKPQYMSLLHAGLSADIV